MRKFAVTALALSMAVSLVAADPDTSRADEVTVFGAASLTDALEEVGRRYREQTGGEVRFSFAASSTLARQIEAGAPAQIFASANESWMDYLAARDLIEADTRISPIGNRLVLVAPAASRQGEVQITPALDWSALLGADARLAVGDPEHVPAGIYARQALERLGSWSALEPRLARADNVRAALALVQRGEAPLGIVYATDAALDEGVEVVGTFPADAHPPITYPFAIVKDQSSAEVRALFDFITGEPGLAVFEAFGFARN